MAKAAEAELQRTIDEHKKAIDEYKQESAETQIKFEKQKATFQRSAQLGKEQTKKGILDFSAKLIARALARWSHRNISTGML